MSSKINEFAIFDPLTIQIIYDINNKSTIKDIMKSTGYTYVAVSKRLQGLIKIRILKCKYNNRNKTYSFTNYGQEIRDELEQISQILKRIDREIKNEYSILLKKIE